MADSKLPADLVAFLQRGKQPKYDPSLCEAGAITFLPLDKLRVEFFPMTPESPDDPHAGQYGSYLVAGVSLVASCKAYDPVGLLLWLPLDGRYGTWDGEHGTLRVFRANVSWSTIARDPPRYINAQWRLKGSAPVSDLAPWGLHPYNAEQLHDPLPDIPELYEASWVRRGVFRNGVQLRHPEELRIRIKCDGVRCEVTSQIKEAKKDAEWSPPKYLSLTADALDQIGPKLERGFWSQPTEAPGGPGGEPATYWSISGFRAGTYHSLSWFYEENREKGDAVHELGKELARLAKLKRFKGNDRRRRTNR
jgi:hypothetical protein